MEESKNELIINIDNGVIDFNALIKRVKDLEEMITKIKSVVETMDEEIAYLIKQDNKTSEILLNHADAVKSLRTHLNEIKTISKNEVKNKKLHISCKLINADDED